MKPIVDYHLHTPLCGHADGEPKQYIQQAIRVGLKEIGFSDHAPLVLYEAPDITMSMAQLPVYYRMIKDLQKKSKRIKVKVGIEADFIPGYEVKTKKILKQYPFDYVIGSVHFIGRWGFDNLAENDEWTRHDVDDVYREYYSLLRQAAKSELFDIMGHVDLVKKFGHYSKRDMTAEIKKTAKTFKKYHVAIEINTSGLRKPAKEIYPSLKALRIYCQAGVPITFGSDSHSPLDVGKDFNKARLWAKKAGYKEYLTFQARKVDQVLPL